MKEINLFDQKFYKPNCYGNLKASGTISGAFNLIGTFKGFVIASSKNDDSTYLIKLYRQAIFEKPRRKYSFLNQVIKGFDKLTINERSIVMDGYNSDGSINKSLN